MDSEARWWRRGQRRERLSYEARIFELYAPDNSLIRSIACADDGGRWVFETSGGPLPAEAAFDYNAPRKKDRLTRSNLHDPLRSLGVEPLVVETFVTAPQLAVLDERITNPARRREVESAACSLEEADDPAFGYFQRGMTWVPHMRTHATSVIADFERAVEINPAYQPRVRAYLLEARRIAGR